MAMAALRSFLKLLKDPPPGIAFELSEAGLAVGQAASPPHVRFYPFEPDILSVSPVRDNVLRPEALMEHVKALAPANGGRKRRTAALILPDYSARVSVLDFDAFPSDSKEQMSLLRFRLKRTVPFDVDAAALSYFVQPRPDKGKKVDVVTAVVPLEIVSRYEAPFRAAGFHTGWVTTSTLAALELLPADGVKILVKRSGRVLSIAVQNGTALKLIRSIELAGEALDETTVHLFPTLAFVEDELGSPPGSLVLCGFDSQAGDVRRRFEDEFGVPVLLLQSRHGNPGGTTAGLLGYLQSLEGY